ncbi:MAG: DUF2218 domain-containing protein [Pseudomonadota bacterium]|nr:DUF2218 domain-containing protein [Pseudomonadota bacterium]
MPLISTSEITLPEAEKILFKLCKHYAIKVPVVFDSIHADIAFPIGRCRISREGDLLRMRCEADSAAKLERVQLVMDEHLELMARRKALPIAWHRQA